MPDPLLNSKERRVFKLLKDLASEYLIHVHAKVRVADVVPVNGSGLPDELFSYALRSHFDFLVTDEGKYQPLVVVEYDGPHHETWEGRGRDAKKDQIADWFGLHVLRCTDVDLVAGPNGYAPLVGQVALMLDALRVPVRLPPPVPPAPPVSPPPPPPVVHPPEVKWRARTESGRGTNREPKGDQTGVLTGLVIGFALAGAVVFGLVVYLTLIAGTRRPVGGAAEPPPAPPPVVQPQTVIAAPPPPAAPEPEAPPPSSPPATEAQLNYVRRLVRSRGWDDRERDRQVERVLGRQRRLDELTKQEASDLIDAWKRK